MHRKIIGLILLVFLCSTQKAYATVEIISDLPSSITIDRGGSIGGAQDECFYFFPTTPDGDVVAGTNQYRLPVFNAYTVTDVYAYVSTSGTTSAITVDVNESGSSILSPKITIDAGENDTTTAATPAVISDTALAANSLLTVDVDSADSGNTGAGLIVRLCGYYN